MRYSMTQLVRAIKQPRLATRELNKLYFTRLGSRRFNPHGISVMDEDWDTLILLDACRYDMFEELHDLPGELEFRISRGSATPEFLRGNFANRDLHDTVYVTANPMFHTWPGLDTEFHTVVNVWEEDGWNDTYQTVLPETMKDYGLQAAKDYPDKRLILHFMQPHYPFLTKETTFDKGHLYGQEEGTLAFWRQIFLGQLSIPTEKIWNLYNDNLRKTLPSLTTLLEELPGKTVVSADHGNMVGDRSFPIPIKEWGHPGGHYLDELVTVPWLVQQNGERRTIIVDAPETQEAADEAEVKKKLEQLGYL